MSETSVDHIEIKKFSDISNSWWNENGKFAPLHKMNPCRLEFIQNCIVQCNMAKPNQAKPYVGLDILDIGCGGGLVCEPMARLGGNVVGIDASDKAIEIAFKHAQEQHLDISYICTQAETLAQQTEHRQKYDVITALEIIEHVADISLFMKSISTLLKPDGLVFFSTINRTHRSYLKAIIAAEHILGWAPKGTHDWKRFVKPHELSQLYTHNGIIPLSLSGMVYSPLQNIFTLSPHQLDTNYILCGTKKAA